MQVAKDDDRVRCRFNGRRRAPAALGSQDDSRLTSEVLRAFLRALFAELRRRARHQWSIPRGQCGAVTFIQRFGSALNANLHFHTLVLDGVYARTERRPTRFLPLPPPSHHEVARVLPRR